MADRRRHERRDELLRSLLSEPPAAPGVDAKLLTTSEVAALFMVSEHTVHQWAAQAVVPTIRTPGGRRLYPAGPVIRLLAYQGDAKEPKGRGR